MEKRQVVDSTDDTVKNGIKTYTWGPHYWAMLHTLAHTLSREGTTILECRAGSSLDIVSRTRDAIAKFVMSSPAALLPCVHCRQSFAGYIKTPDLELEPYIQAGRLEECLYLLHNTVNRKLGKPFAPTCLLKQYHGTENVQAAFHRHFWPWIQSIAFNFPADIQRTRNDKKTPFEFPADSFQTHALWERLRVYVLFFDLLGQFLPDDTPLFVRWNRAYVCHTPSLLTFACRTNLLKWVFLMQHACGYGSTSFISLLETLHPMRSTTL